MERFDYSASLHQVAKDKYDRIKNNYGKNSRAPFGNICPTFDEVLNYLIVVLYRLNYISQKSFDLMIYKVILDFFRSLSVTRALVDQDRYHTSIYFNTFNPHKLSFYYDAKRILQGRFSRWTKKLADVGVDETSLVDNVALKLFKKCVDSRGGEISGIIGLVHKSMIHDIYDGLRLLGVYGKSKQVTQEDGLNTETTDSPKAIGKKRIPADIVDSIDAQESPIEMPEKREEEEYDLFAGIDVDGFEIDMSLRRCINDNPVKFYDTLASVANGIRGFWPEFADIKKYRYADKLKPLTQKQAIEIVARSKNASMATISSRLKRSRDALEAMGSQKADMLIKKLHERYGQT
jgi:hypothetical protein